MSYSRYAPEVRKPDWVKELEAAWPGSSWKPHQYSPGTWEFIGYGFVASAGCHGDDANSKSVLISILGSHPQHGRGADSKTALENLKRDLRTDLSKLRAKRVEVKELEQRLGDAERAARTLGV